MTGGTYFTIALALGSVALVAMTFAVTPRRPRHRRFRVYLALLGVAFAAGVVAAAAVYAINPVSPNAPGATGWEVGHLKWLPIAAVLFTTVGLTVVEVICTALGDHLGHPYGGCDSPDCRT